MQLNLERSLPEDIKCAGVIITHNRLDCLKKCLKCCLESTHPFDGIVVVNNDSTDGTSEYLEGMRESTGIDFVSQENAGAAGGWHAGMTYAFRLGYDAVYLLDDDCFLTPDTFTNLFNRFKELGRPADLVLTSYALSTDGKPCGPLLDIARRGSNFQIAQYPDRESVPSLKISNDIYFNWGHFMLGVFISKSVADHVGLPDPKFFIRGEDYEYALRCYKSVRIGCCLDSVVIHGTPVCAGLPHQKNYYQIRNHIYINRLYFPSWKNSIPARIAKILALSFSDTVRNRAFDYKLMLAAIYGVIGYFKNPIFKK